MMYLKEFEGFCPRVEHPTLAHVKLSRPGLFPTCLVVCMTVNRTLLTTDGERLYSGEIWPQ